MKDHIRHIKEINPIKLLELHNEQHIYVNNELNKVIVCTTICLLLLTNIVFVVIVAVVIVAIVVI